MPSAVKRSKSAGRGDYIRKSFGDKKGGKGNRRKTKDQRKKGQPKWRNVQ